MLWTCACTTVAFSNIKCRSLERNNAMHDTLATEMPVCTKNFQDN